MDRPRKLLTTLLGTCLVLGGCLTGEDDGLNYGADSPVLIIELYWDEFDDRDIFYGANCERAGVDTMTWSLNDRDGNEVSSDADVCSDLVISGLEPGEYELSVSGMDEAGDVVWETSCTNLLLVRFDTAYYCDVEQR